MCKYTINQSATLKVQHIWKVLAAGERDLYMSPDLNLQTSSCGRNRKFL